MDGGGVGDIGGGGHGQSQFGNKDRSIEKTRPAHMASQYMFDASAGGQGYSPQIGDMGDHLTQPSVGMVNQFTVPPQEQNHQQSQLNQAMKLMM